jgi:hypothetical protein
MDAALDLFDAHGELRRPEHTQAMLQQAAAALKTVDEPRLLRPGLHSVCMREESGDGRGDERGMQEGLQGARPLGVDRIQAVARLIQPDAEFYFAPYPVEVGDLPRANPRGQVRQEETVTLGGLGPHKAQRQRVAAPADMHIGVNDPAIEAQRLLSSRASRSVPAKNSCVTCPRAI